MSDTTDLPAETEHDPEHLAKLRLSVGLTLTFNGATVNEMLLVMSSMLVKTLLHAARKDTTDAQIEGFFTHLGKGAVAMRNGLPLPVPEIAPSAKVH